MDLSIILQKAAGGELLSDEERSFLREYRPGGENEAGELQNQLQTAISERDSIRAELDELRFRNSVSRLAGEYKPIRDISNISAAKRESTRHLLI